MKIKRFFLSRKFVILMIILTILTIASGYFFPQGMTSSRFEIEAWKEDHPVLAPIYSLLGLGHIYTSPWFSSLLAMMTISMLISTIDQARSAYRKTVGAAYPESGKIYEARVSTDILLRRLKSRGYIKTTYPGKGKRFVKHPWGYWGNALLHAGMAVVIISALAITVTESRGLLHLVEGELYIPGEPWVVEEAGMLASQFILPVSVKLEKVKAEFWETDDVKNISTVISVTGTNGKTVERELGINRTLDIFGLRIYQGRRFGDAFFIEIRDEDGNIFKEILQIEKPRRKDTPSYGNFFIEGIPFMLKAKYLPDTRRRSMKAVDPILTLRLVSPRRIISDVSVSAGGKLKIGTEEKSDVVGETDLRIAQTGRLGPYSVRLAGVRQWCGVIFVRSSGASGIFAGFFIIIIGASLSYLFPPREAVLIEGRDGPLIRWRAARFETLYEDERGFLCGKPGGNEPI